MHNFLDLAFGCRAEEDNADYLFIARWVLQNRRM